MKIITAIALAIALASCASTSGPRPQGSAREIFERASSAPTSRTVAAREISHPVNPEPSVAGEPR